VGCRPYSKKTTKLGLDPVHGFNASSVGLSSSPGMFLGLASSAAAVASPSPKALGCLSIELPVSFVRFSSPLKVSSPAAIVEKFSTAVLQQVALGCSSIAVPTSKKVVLVGYDAVVDSSLVSSSSFGAADGWVLVSRAIPGLSSPAAADDSIPSSHGPTSAYSGPESSVKAIGSVAYVVTGSVSSGSMSSVAAFGPVPNSFGLVLESFGPNSSAHASLPFHQASSGQPFAPAFFLGVDSAFEGSFPIGDSFSATSSRATTLGERLRFSLPVMSESGAPIYPSEFKSVLRYYCRLKVGRGEQLDASLIDEALTAINAPMALPFGAHPSSEPGGGTVSKTPSTSLLWRGFCLPSRVGGSPLSLAQSVDVKIRGAGAPPRLGGPPPLSSSLEVGVSSRGDVFEDSRVNGLSQFQKWPVDFGPSGEVVLWEQGDEIWDGEDGVPLPFGCSYSQLGDYGCL